VSRVQISVSFVCKYCDETLPFEQTHPDTFASDQYHSCYGERIGIIAMQYGDSLKTINGREIRIEVGES